MPELEHPAEMMMAAPLSTVQVGERFRSLPPHITLLPWFKLPETSSWETLRERIEDDIELDRFGKTIVGGFEHFGPDQNIRVARLGGVMFSVHAKIYATVKAEGGVFDETYAGLSWNPHITGYEGGEMDAVTPAGLMVVERGLGSKSVKWFHSWEEDDEATS